MANSTTCPHCQTELSDTDISNGICPSCGKPIEGSAETATTPIDSGVETVVKPLGENPCKGRPKSAAGGGAVEKCGTSVNHRLESLGLMPQVASSWRHDTGGFGRCTQTWSNGQRFEDGF